MCIEYNMNIKYTAGILALLCLIVTARATDIKPIEYLVWGPKGYGGVEGSEVPQGKVWLIRAAGLFTSDSKQMEYMMEIKKRSAGGGFFLIALERKLGVAGATPALALSRDHVILVTGERLQGRCVGLSSDREIGISYVAWEFPESMLPQLLGISSSPSVSPALDSVNREIKRLETELHAGEL